MPTQHGCRGVRILLLVTLSATIGLTVLTGAVAADPGFKVNITSWDKTESPGGNLDVTAKINNTGPTDTQEIELVDGGSEDLEDLGEAPTVATKSRTIASGSNKTVTLTWTDVPERNQPLIPAVKTEDDAASKETELEWNEFVVEEFTVNRTDVSTDELFTLNAIIKNIGTDGDRQTITLERSNENTVVPINSSSEGLDGAYNNNGESTEVSFTDSVENPGEYTYTIETDDETASLNVIVGGFNVEIDETDTDNTNLTVDATISKRGSYTETQNISFKINGSVPNNPVYVEGNTDTKRYTPSTLSRYPYAIPVTVEGTEEQISFTYNTGKSSYTKNASITTQRPDIAAETITRSQKGVFDIEILGRTDNNVPAGEDLSVWADITNNGADATQTVQLLDSETDPPEVIQQKEVFIKQGASKNVELVWESVQASGQGGDPKRGVLPEVQTESSSVILKEYIPVISAPFEVRDDEPYAFDTVESDSVHAGEQVKFEAHIRNRGTNKSTQTITLLGPEGDEIRQRNLELGSKKQEEIEFKNVTVPSSEGTHEYTVQSKTPPTAKTYSVRDTKQITVGEFNVDISDWSVEGQQIRADATVSKQGDYKHTQPIELVINGNVEDKKQVTLGNTPRTSNQQTVSLSSSVLSGGFPKTIKVRSKDDVAVEQAVKANIEDGPTINSVADNLVQSGDTLEFTYTADGPNVNTVTISLIGPEGRIVATKPLGPGDGAKESIEIPGRDEVFDGGYSMRLLVTDDFDRRVSVTENSAFTVSNVINPEAVGVLGEPVTRSPAGSFVSIPTGGEYMIIGGDKRDGDRTQFLDVLDVSGDSTVLNTRRIGTTNSSSTAYGDGVTSLAHSTFSYRGRSIDGLNANASVREGTPFEGVSFPGASSLAEFRKQFGMGTRTRPLQAGRYQLVAGENGRIQIGNGAPDFSRPVGRSNLILTQTQRIGEIETYVAPPAPADESDGQLPADAVEAETVTIGERLIIEVPATGMWGATLKDSESELTAEDISTLLGRQEGVHIEFDGKRGDPNAGLGDLQFDSVTSSDISLSTTTGDLIENETVTGGQPIIDGYYIVIDTRGTEPFSTQPEPGSVFEFDMAYESPPGESYRFESSSGQPAPFSSAVEPQDGIEHYPYFGDDDTTVERNATVRFTEPSITYARTRPDGSLIVPAEEGGQIFGSTTMVPGSQVTLRLISGDGATPDLVDIVETTVEDDRTFAASADFSQLQPGQNVEVEFASQNRLEGNRVIDKRSAYVVDNFENPARFQITSFAGDIQVQQRDALDELQATITNDGSIASRQLVEFRIDGEPIRSQSITLSGGGTETLDLSGQFVTLPTGTYQYTVATDDDQRTGQLTVGAPDTGTVITDTASQGATTSGQVGGGETTGGTDDGSDSGEPGGLFSLMGVRTRDVAVATAIAGATHILGYWT